ncbi:AEC family transporter [Glaciihabitans sp. dw_435]|uniref:AEC family transporter n=1 Tax=Glaciihabitans sp. dw_435 TaxID=2720081 RepID=UPI001BD5960E|nr:AEC family transporter [Glaciihabitans sp. dw_435]
MGGVLTGFGIIGAIILIGYIVGRTGILGEHQRFVLSRLVFFVLSPCLLFTVLADADVHTLFSKTLAVSSIAAILSCLIFAAVAIFVWRRPAGDVVIGSAASGYVNANNIGIPVAVYLLGDPALSAPVVLLQLLVLAPVILTILDVTTTGTASLGRILLQPVKNPLIIGSALGVLLSVTNIHLPAPVMEPFRLIGAASVPVVLISFGMSLHGQKLLEAGSNRRDVILASVIKLVVMPVIAWFFGHFVFGLEGTPLFAVVMLAALPSAQNVLNYAQRYDRGETLARDTVLVTTVGSVPVLMLAAVLLH